MYYPASYTKAEIEVKGMTIAREKNKLTTEISGLMTEDQFQNGMPVMYNMLESVIKIAYE